jgi:imidazolonepropionase-like amidohydrolase
MSRTHLFGLFTLLSLTPAAAQTTAITHVTVLPMDADRALPDQTVVIDGGRIAALGPAAATPVPRGATVVDGRGKFLIPGLFDTHIHLRPQSAATDLLLYVANGITTVQSMHGSPWHLELRGRVAAGAVPGPRILTTGPTTASAGVRTPDDAERLVREQQAAGYDAIKQYGVGEATPRETYHRLRAAAREQGIRLVGHAPRNLPFSAVLEERQESVDHMEEIVYTHTPIVAQFGPYLDIQFGRVQPANLDSLRRALPPIERLDSAVVALAREMKAAGIAVTPTMVAFRTISISVADEFFTRLARPEMVYVEPMVRARWGAGLNRYRSGGWATKLELMSTILTASYELQLRLLRAFHDAGVPLMTGTDAPLDLVLPGFTLHEELRLFVAAGLTPYDALVAATRAPAERLGLAARTGTIAQGKDADVVMLDADPRADIRATERIAGVWVRGAHWPRQRIRATLDSIATAHRARDRQLAPVLGAFEVGDARHVLAAYAATGDTTAALAQLVESMVNRLGYRHLGRGDVDSALAVFVLNTEHFPSAFNTWDSLGEAWLVKGDSARAIENYEKSLALNPDNTNAREYLERLRRRP